MKIKEIKLSLMEKDPDVKEVAEGKDNFIITNSAVFNVEKYLNNVVPNNESIIFEEEITEEEFNDFLSNALEFIYKDLMSLESAGDPESLGIWVTTDEGVFDNSMKISVMNDLKEYGADDVKPVYELYKMTLEHNIENVSY